jgi:hypothetical protein
MSGPTEQARLHTMTATTLPRTFAATLLFLGVVSSGLAEFSVPRDVYEVDRLAEAVAVAKEKEKPITLILSDPDTTCPLCANASTSAMDEVSRHSVVVLLRSGEKWKLELSPPLVRALGSEVTGKIIPRLIVAPPDLGSVWATMTYDEIKGGRKFRDLRATVNDIATGRASAPEADSVQRWTLTDGRYYQGTFVRLEGDRLVLKIPDSGNEVDLPLSDYAPGTIAYAKTIAAREAGSQSPESVAEKGSVHEWTSAEGKILKASFVSLDGSALTLRNERGETVRLDLERLNEASRSQAKSLAGN